MTVTGVPIASLANGVIFNKITLEARGELQTVTQPASGVTVYAYAHVPGYEPTSESARIQVYSDEALTVPVSQPLTTDTNGNVPGYIATGQFVDLVASAGPLPEPQVLFVNSAASATLSGDASGTSGATVVNTVKGGKTPLTADQNLADIANAATARTNLGLGSAATQAASAFDAAGTATTAASAAQSAAETFASTAAGTAQAAAEAASIPRPFAAGVQTSLGDGVLVATDGTGKTIAGPATASVVSVAGLPGSVGDVVTATSTGSNEGVWAAPSGGGGSLPIGHFVAPSADTSGATDVAAINAALAANSAVWLHGAYYVDASIVMPSNTTLVLSDASIFLANGSNCNIIRNADYLDSSGGNTQLRILGIGKALLNGNLANQSSANTWQGMGILLSHVTDYEVGNLQFTSVQRYGVNPQHTSDGYIHDLWADTIGGEFQAICQSLGDCANLLIERIRGISEDDAVALSTGDAPEYQDYYADGVPTGNIADVVIRDVEVSHTTSESSVNAVRIYAGGGSTMQRITIENVRERYPTQAQANITIGPDTFAASPPAVGDVCDIVIRDCAAHILIQETCSNVVIDGLEIPGASSATVIPIAFQGDPANARTMNDIVVRNVTYSGPAQTNALIDFNNESSVLVVNRLDLTGVKLTGSLAGLISNEGATITGLKLPDTNQPGFSSEALPGPGANYSPKVGLANVFAVDQAIAAPGGGLIVPTPDGSKAYRLAISNSGTLTTTRVPYLARFLQSLGPVAYLRLGEASGVAALDVLNVFQGSYIGAPTLGSTGLLNANGDDTATSVAFNGTTQYVIAPDGAAIDFTGAFSIVAIIKPTGVSALQGIVAKGVAGGVPDYSLCIDSGHLEATQALNFWTDTTTLTAGNTYLVGMTYDHADVRFFVAGTLSSTHAFGLAVPVSSGANLFIARRSDIGFNFAGPIQEVALFPSRLPDATFTQLHAIAGV